MAVFGHRGSAINTCKCNKVTAGDRDLETLCNTAATYNISLFTCIIKIMIKENIFETAAIAKRCSIYLQVILISIFYLFSGNQV